MSPGFIKRFYIKTGLPAVIIGIVNFGYDFAIDMKGKIVTFGINPQFIRLVRRETWRRKTPSSSAAACFRGWGQVSGGRRSR